MNDGDDQDELFDENGEAFARYSDPDTSRDAAEDLRGLKATRLERMVFEALQSEPKGLTTHEIGNELHLPRDTVSPRIQPLIRKGLITATTERRPGPSGKNCIVWKATRFVQIPK